MSAARASNTSASEHATSANPAATEASASPARATNRARGMSASSEDRASPSPRLSTYAATRQGRHRARSSGAARREETFVRQRRLPAATGTLRDRDLNNTVMSRRLAAPLGEMDQAAWPGLGIDAPSFGSFSRQASSSATSAALSMSRVPMKTISWRRSPKLHATPY